MAYQRDIFVQTEFGAVRGAANSGVAVFHAIPYAAPPVGPLRFATPHDAIPWRDVRDCTKVGAIAPQTADSIIEGVMGVPPPLVQSEDCLTLSVWTPAPDAALRPVFVWIHGGAFNHGSGAWPCYSGEVLACRGDIVVVVINYRLGVLGFLQVPGMAPREPRHLKPSAHRCDRSEEIAGLIALALIAKFTANAANFVQTERLAGGVADNEEL